MPIDVWIGLATLVSANLPPQAVQEAGCSALVKTEQGTTVVDDANLKVLEQTRTSADFVYRRENTQAIRCVRTDLVPVLNDVKVLRAGYPLYVVQAVAGTTRAGVLEVSGGQVRFRVVQGELTPDEKQRLLTRLNEIQEAGRSWK